MIARLVSNPAGAILNDRYAAAQRTFSSGSHAPDPIS